MNDFSRFGPQHSIFSLLLTELPGWGNNTARQRVGWTPLLGPSTHMFYNYSMNPFSVFYTASTLRLECLLR